MDDWKSWIIASILGIAMLVIPYWAQAAEVTLAWNPVAEATGYKMYHGNTSRTYETPADVSEATTHTITLDQGTYYFAVTAYNLFGESGYSEEVSTTIGDPATYLPPETTVITSKTETFQLVGGGEISVTVTY